MTAIQVGALCWNQYTDWPSLLAAGVRAEDLGYDSLWTWDHLYPIVGSSDGPIHEGWLTLAAWAQATERIRIGLMVGANTFREPALTAKMATTLDHISGGRATLGIGAAWFEEEHTAYGLEFGDGFPERLRWLAEALPIMRGMLRGETATAKGPHYQARSVRNDPPPIQDRLPLLIGGGGEQVTLKLVARYADANNVGGGIDQVRRKEAVLLRHCETVGRDPAEIERTTGLGVVVIRDSRAKARKASDAIFARNGQADPWKNQPVGTPEDVAAFIAPFLEIGYRHVIAGFPNPYDEESMTRLATDVRPLLGASV
ncbi:MAG TPA: TIGR03560 family F420-dependent LLM class oxidoreductase [Candidatus Limnocylindrales bacterium]|nr:TIGR03560 family F420-dependent LLM class oxidoreductase [Candidatus Limnocylindrales bacterium]